MGACAPGSPWRRSLHRRKRDTSVTRTGRCAPSAGAPLHRSPSGSPGAAGHGVLRPLLAHASRVASDRDPGWALFTFMAFLVLRLERGEVTGPPPPPPSDAQEAPADHADGLPQVRHVAQGGHPHARRGLGQGCGVDCDSAPPIAQSGYRLAQRAAQQQRRGLHPALPASTPSAALPSSVGRRARRTPSVTRPGRGGRRSTTPRSFASQKWTRTARFRRCAAPAPARPPLHAPSGPADVTDASSSPPSSPPVLTGHVSSLAPY
jgi:hypothetical protein